MPVTGSPGFRMIGAKKENLYKLWFAIVSAFMTNILYP